MSSNGPENKSSNEAAFARKRRIAMRKKQRSSSAVSTSSSSTAVSTSSSSTAEENLRKRSHSAIVKKDDGPIADSSPSSDCAEEVAITTSSNTEERQPKRKKPHITGIKRASRYDPGVDLSKEELKAWRKEARRVRNRESAAASRKKNRESIQRLETELEALKTKYAAALKYIVDLEEDRQKKQPNSVQVGSSHRPPSAVVDDLEDSKKGSSSSLMMGEQEFSHPRLLPSVADKNTKGQSPSQSISTTSSNVALSDSSHHHHHQFPVNTSLSKHVINTISRPIAAKISPGAYEKTENDDDDRLKKRDGCSLMFDTIVSDEDTPDDARKRSMSFSSLGSSSFTTTLMDPDCPSHICTSSSDDDDDESMIESDQPLYLDAIPEGKVEDSDDNSSMADFLAESLLFNGTEDNNTPFHFA